jgi:hypothetical protein
MIITAFNLETVDLEKTLLTTPVSESAINLEVQNNNLFSAANLRAMIGEMGHEKSEIVTIASVSAEEGLVVSALKFSHPVDTPVYILPFDKVQFYRSTGGSDGNYTEIATVDMDVDNSNKKTVYDDVTGLATYYYKVRFYHSLQLYASDYSGIIKGSGYGRQSVGHICNSFLSEVSDLNQDTITKTELIEWLNECSDDLITRGKKPYEFLKARVALTKTANRNYIDMPVDTSDADTDNNSTEQIVWKIRNLKYNFVDSSTNPVTDETYLLRYLPEDEFQSRFQDNTISASTVSDRVRYWTYDFSVNRLRFNPPFETTQTAAFYLYFYKYFNTLDNDSDNIETPNSLVYKQYLRWRYFLKKAESDASFMKRAETEENKYNVEVFKLQSTNRKEVGQPRSFRPDTRNVQGYRKY